MQPRYYQLEAIHGNSRFPGILKAWETWKNVLLVLPTGTGKTIVFSLLTAELVRRGATVLILAHRDELIRQAAAKLEQATGLACAIEKADESAVGCLERVIVGSVQTLISPYRRDTIRAPDYIIVDEAHHAVGDSYQAVLAHWPNAKVLGVTATPDRADMKQLGTFFEALAYEYSLPQAIVDKFLCPIRALTLPVKIDLTGISPDNGDFSKKQVATALEPYIPELCRLFAENARDRKGLVFVPLCATGKKVVEAFKTVGMRAYYCDGDDRSQIKPWEQDGAGSVMVNAMLLTEGYDHPPVNALAVWRFTQSRPFYAQMAGRGTRICEGKSDLLLIDNLFLSKRHQLCRPAVLVEEDPEVADAITDRTEREGAAVELNAEAIEQARLDVIAERERNLAKKLLEMRHKKRELVDPLQFAMSIGAAELTNYAPALGAESAAPNQTQIDALAKCGIYPAEIASAGQADRILATLTERKDKGLASPKQIRILERCDVAKAGRLTFDEAQRIIRRIAANGWRKPGKL